MQAGIKEVVLINNNEYQKDWNTLDFFTTLGIKVRVIDEVKISEKRFRIKKIL